MPGNIFPGDRSAPTAWLKPGSWKTNSGNASVKCSVDKSTSDGSTPEKTTQRMTVGQQNNAECRHGSADQQKRSDQKE